MDKRIAAIAGLLVNLDQFPGVTDEISALVAEIVPAAFQDDVVNALRSEAVATAQEWGQFGDTVMPPDGGLRPPFAVLGGENITGQYLPAKPLRLADDVIFPQSGPPTVQEYASLWRSFIDEARALRGESDPLTLIESLQDVMRRHLWCVPGSQPDVSLYDQSRVTAALSTALTEPADGQTRAYLVSGDISGIQRFIFQVISRGATRQLRARSFYLQLLTEAAARYFLRQLGLPITSMIYAGGGHFYLVVPPSYKEHAAALRRHLDLTMLRHHDGDLYLSVAGVAMRAADFTDHERYAAKWSELQRALTRDKYRRYATSLNADELFDIVFGPRDEYDVNREEFRRRIMEREQQADAVTDDSPNSANEEYSRLHTSFREISGVVRNMAWLVLAEIPPQDRRAGSLHDALAMLGMAVLVIDQRGDLVGDTNIPQPRRLTALRIEDDAPGDPRGALAGYNCPIAISTRYMVNATARKWYVEGQEVRPGREFATFSEIQRASQGIKRLGVLRMDVDDLGALFGSGYVWGKRSFATLARSAGLSFNMSLFFEGWVSALCREINTTRRASTSDAETDAAGVIINDGDEAIEVEPLYAVYSGGDDLFILGAWDVLPELAQWIHADFAVYSCGNPRAHVSGGITLHGGKYPLYQAAEDADKVLKEAKNIGPHDSNTPFYIKKNAITFLGEPVKWERWADVVWMREQIVSVMTTDQNSGSGRRSLIQILLRLNQQYRQLQQEARMNRSEQPQIVWGPWVWRSAYQLTRFADRHQDQREVVRAIQDRLVREDFKGIEIAGLAARWAEVATRKERL